MLKQIRANLAATGGVSVLAALIAIGWGLSTLQRVAEERSAELEALAAARAEQEAALIELARKRHPAGKDLPDAAAEYPTAEDLDPLDRGEATA